MDISFIIVNWNTKDLTRNATNSIIDTCPQNLKYEIIVVDNNSSDGSTGFLRRLFQQYDNFILLALENNIGYGPAHNEGFKISRGEWIFFLNSDVILLYDCIKNIYRAASIDKMKGLYSPRILNEDLTDQDVYDFLLPYTYDLFFKLFTRKQTPYTKLLKGIVTFESILGVAYFIHREFLREYGSWSNDYVMYAEDWDFCFKLYKNHKTCTIVLDAKLVHLGQSSLKIRWNTTQRAQIMEASNYLFAKKYAQPGTYELYWLYILFKSLYHGYIKDVGWRRGLVKAKLWFLKEIISAWITGKNINMNDYLSS